MPGLQHIRHVRREREIQLVTHRKSGGIKGVISTASIDFQHVPARVIIQIGVVVLNKPLGVHIIRRAEIEAVLPAVFGDDELTATGSSTLYVEVLPIARTHRC